MEIVEQNNQANKIPVMTETIVKFYTALAALEKKGKKDTEMYKDILSLLLCSIRYEEKDYQNYHLSSQDEEILKNVEDFFQLHSNDMLTRIRSFNHSHPNYLFTVNGIINGDMQQYLQSRIEENFMMEICRYLKYEELTEDEKNYLIYYKYEMLTISKSLEETWISGELMVPYTNVGMAKEELYKSDKHIIPQVKSISQYLCLLHDSDITGHTILCALYTKSCMSMLSPSTYETIAGAIRKCIKSNEDTMDTDLEKMCNLLSYIIEQPSYQKKMQ